MTLTTKAPCRGLFVRLKAIEAPSVADKPQSYARFGVCIALLSNGHRMKAEELANKFKLKVAAALVEKERQEVIARDNEKKRTADMDHCRRAMENEVVPFLEEVKHHFGEDQFSFATQIERNDHRPVGVSFIVGNGAPTSITTAFGNIIVTRVGDSGTKKGTPFVYAPDVEPYISNSGDLTREKIAKLLEMVIDD